MDVIKGIFVNFRPLKYLPTYLQYRKHEESIRIRNYTLQTEQVGVHTTLKSRNCAATYVQSSKIANICYVSRNTPANTITLAHPVKSGMQY